MLPPFVFQLPPWILCHLSPVPQDFCLREDRMAWVIELAHANIRHGTGGPFAAGVFDLQTHRLVAPGVNLVPFLGCSIAHAEMIALLFAQQALGVYDLGAEGLPAHELVTSTEPCAMCYGAIPWSGIRELTCGTRASDARSIGFDEGEKPSDWVQALERRGIAVHQDIDHDGGMALLKEYARKGGVRYNGRQGRRKDP